jgi:arylsulfatase A-like enzyme
MLHLNDPIAETMPPEKTRPRPTFRGRTLADVHRWMNRYWQYEAETFAARTGAAACRWLEENCNGSPFFLWVDFFDPHEPWDPPEYFVRRYDPDYTGTPMIHPNYGRSDVYTPAELRNLRAHYVAEAELVDRSLGRILEKIDDLGLWDDSVVAITSDHGFSIGEHDRAGKSNISEGDRRYWPIYPEVGHVPFLIADSALAAGSDHRFLAQAPDFLPTVCELADVAVDPREPVQGRSFVEAMISGGGHRDCAVSGCHLNPNRPGGIPACATTPFVATAEWGYAPVGAAGKPELYRLARDPLAAEDMAEENPAQVKAMHQLLVEYLRGNGAPEPVVAFWSREPRLGTNGEWAIDYADA